MLREFTKAHRVILCLALGIPLLFALYVAGLSHNPPGFFIDESAMAYNAWLVANTGAGEAGGRWPIMFQHFTGPHLQYVSATYTYILAAVFALFGPSILWARLVSAVAVFAAALLLGVLGRRISGKIAVGAIVTFIALATPWLFELSRLVFEASLVPLFLVLLLLSLYTAHTRPQWRPVDSLKIAAALGLLSYTYSSGRIVAPLLCIGLLLFATNRRRLTGVIATMALYGVSLVPFLLFARRFPGALTHRFHQVSYIQSSSSVWEILFRFFRRCLEDLSPWRWLVTGDASPRHHVPGSLGSFLFGALVLSLLGVVIVLVKHRRDRWWIFICFGVVVSLIPGAITVDQFHTLRLIALPIFVCVIAIPAISWLLEGHPARDAKASATAFVTGGPKRRKRWMALALLLVLTALQAGYFQWVFQRAGPQRGGYFDAEYKEVFDAATASVTRPIYLIDGAGPSYVHALWYATIEGRRAADFIQVENEGALPTGAMVISSGPACSRCAVLLVRGPYVLYRVP